MQDITYFHINNFNVGIPSKYAYKILPRQDQIINQELVIGNAPYLKGFFRFDRQLIALIDLYALINGYQSYKSQYVLVVSTGKYIMGLSIEDGFLRTSSCKKEEVLPIASLQNPPHLTHLSGMFYSQPHKDAVYLLDLDVLNF